MHFWQHPKFAVFHNSWSSTVSHCSFKSFHSHLIDSLFCNSSQLKVKLEATEIWLTEETNSLTKLLPVKAKAEKRESTALWTYKKKLCWTPWSRISYIVKLLLATTSLQQQSCLMTTFAKERISHRQIDETSPCSAITLPCNQTGLSSAVVCAHGHCVLSQAQTGLR